MFLNSACHIADYFATTCILKEWILKLKQLFAKTVFSKSNFDFTKQLMYYLPVKLKPLFQKFNHAVSSCDAE